MTMRVQSCSACAACFFPPRLLCAVCFGQRFDDVEIEKGTVEVCTTLRHRAGIAEDLNVTLAQVRLTRGLSVLARLPMSARTGDIVLVSQASDGAVRAVTDS